MYLYIEGLCKRGHVSLHVDSLSLYCLHMIDSMSGRSSEHDASVFELTFLLLEYHTGGPFKRNPTWEQVMSEVDVTFRYLHMNMNFSRVIKII